MTDEELKEELQDIKRLLVLQLIVDGVHAGEIEQILELGEGNFNKAFHAGKLIKRMKKKNAQIDAESNILNTLEKMIARSGGKNGKKRR